MFTPVPDLTCPTLLPENLLQLLKERAPSNTLAAVMTRTAKLLNGGQTSLASAWLNAEERQQFDRFSFEKRRSEWLCGRICAKQATIDLLTATEPQTIYKPLDLNIVATSSGRPRIISKRLPPGTPAIDISISHSHDKAVAIAGHGLCGVDIQYLSDTLYKVKNRYCTETESALLDTIPAEELVQLGLLWVSKEAVRKCLSSIRLLGFLDMHLEHISCESGFQLLNMQLDEPFGMLGTLSVTTNVHDRYALAVCTISRERLDAGAA